MSGIISGKRVLLIHGVLQQAESLERLLRDKGIMLHTASNAHNAISQMMRCTFDVVAMNAAAESAEYLMELLLDLRHAKNTLLLMYPVEDPDDRAVILNRGVDICLSSSHQSECGAAICALLRRPSSGYPTEATPPGRIIHKALVMDPQRQKVTMRGQNVSLTSLEFKVLYFLASNPSIVFTKDLIYERVWREKSLYGSKGVSDQISAIRKKLNLSPQDCEYIKTIKGVGYCFAP